RWELVEYLHSLQQLVSVLSRDSDCLLHRDRLRIVVLIGDLPLVRFLAPEDAELQRTPAQDAAEPARELVVVLELQPIDQAVSIAVRMHLLQQRLAIEISQHVRAEAGPERRVESVQLSRGEEFSLD